MPDRAVLTGMTWDHARGFDPMIATSARYSELHPGVEIAWEKRSLQAFADRPIKDMANEFDLMVIDHPHVGEIAESGLLVSFTDCGRETDLDTLAAQSVGLSHQSYQFGGEQWGLAIDAATPVAAFRPDRLDSAPERWSDVLDLARAGQVCFALVPVNALMTFFGLAKNLGFDVAEYPDRFMANAEGIRVLEEMKQIVALMDTKCLALDPIGIFDWMGNDEAGPAYSPFGYGYTNYSRDGYCPYPLVFANAPGLENLGSRGTVIGGTGISVSSSSKHRDIAVDYAFWVAGAECQGGIYFESGGQPGNAMAWESEACNKACHNFFFNTRETLETSWVRPRYHGYMGFQEQGGNIIHACLRGEAAISATLAALEQAYRESRL